MYKTVIIGRSNVGKSSLFNRIVGRRVALVHDVAGTTRDVITKEIEFQNKAFLLSDTAGYLKEKGDLITEKSMEKLQAETEDADLLVLVTDGNVVPTKEDMQIVELARKLGKETALFINKMDDPKKDDFLKEYQRLGFKRMGTGSVIHNKGILDLLLEMTKDIKSSIKSEKEKVETEEIKIVLIGRPNVGKSSILNAIAKKERAIVTDVAGTTRDIITEKIESNSMTLLFSDTGGARKPGKIGKAYISGEPVEKYSYLRTEKEIETSDVVLIILDASEKIAAQDLHLAGKAQKAGKGIILVINKWDLVSELTQEDFLKRLQGRFSFMLWVPAIFVSAKTGRNIAEIVNLVQKVKQSREQKINTSKLNRILENFVIDNMPKGTGTYKPRVFFMTQSDIKPPTFSITSKYPQAIHFSWKRALENELRRQYDFSGTPIKIEFKKES